MENLSSKSKYQLAQEKVERLREFYNHLIVFIIVMSGLFLLNYFTSSYFWVIFPLLGWGLGILGHASATFEWNLLFGKDWEERQIKKFMNNDNL